MWSSLIKKFGLLAEFIIILLEYACFPVPSEVILPLTGAMSISGQLPLLLVIFISVIAGILGSLICYYIGYFGGGKLFKKLSQKKQFQTSLEKYQKYSNISVCIGRVFPYVEPIFLLLLVCRINKFVHILFILRLVFLFGIQF